jgi:hypothetical protein
MRRLYHRLREAVQSKAPPGATANSPRALDRIGATGVP